MLGLRADIKMMQELNRNITISPCIAGYGPTAQALRGV